MAPSKQDQVTAACKFQPSVWKLDLKDQAAFVRNCVEILGPAYREELRFRQEVVRWINSD